MNKELKAKRKVGVSCNGFLRSQMGTKKAAPFGTAFQYIMNENYSATSAATSLI
ncbi:MAG: hypothetical protein ACI9GM_000240 [Salibacteraceae bacterium]|jgi:hypothetical protein